MGSQLSNCIVESSKPTLSARTSFLDPTRATLNNFTRHISLSSQSQINSFSNDGSFNKTPIKRSRSFNTQFSQSITPNSGFSATQNDIALKNFTILREFDTDNVYKGKRYLVAKKHNPALLFTMTNCKKSVIKDQQLDLFTLQRQVFESDNPFISKLLYLIENKNTLFAFQTYFSGLDLAFQVQKYGFFKEKVARFYLAEMILALEGLPNSVSLHHSLTYYLDMKSMLVDRDGHLNMNIMSPLLRATKLLGSSMDERYNPPETFHNSIEKSSFPSVCAWKLGVFLYEMLSGEKAFQNSDEIMANSLKFSHQFTGASVDLIGKLLLTDPHKRLGNSDLSEVKTHEFFAGMKWNEILEKRSIGPLAISSREEDTFFNKDQEKAHNTLKTELTIQADEEKTDLFESPKNSTAEMTNSFLSDVSEEEEEGQTENN